jgi:hypothetical protein
MMQDGELFPLKTPELHTNGSEYGLWPTPVKNEGPGGQQMKLTDAVAVACGLMPKYLKTDGMTRKHFPTPTAQDAKNNGAPSQMERNTKPLNAEVGGALNPPWVEWLMGWPIAWTDLQPLATDRFRQWLDSHGRS